MKFVIVLMFAMLLAVSAFAMDEIVVTELMYNSINDANGDDVEWIEFLNHSDAAIDLTGWYVLDNSPTHTHVPLDGVMAPGDVMVLAGDLPQFMLQYPTVTNLFAADFSVWGLNNGGDGVRIFNAMDELVFTMDYDDGNGWPTEPDGDGPSLLLINSGVSDFSDPAGWTFGPDWGTPGVIEGTVATESVTLDQIKSLYR